MKHRIAMGVLALAVLAVASAVAGDALKSGPQTGEKLGGAFDVRASSGARAGESYCLV